MTRALLHNRKQDKSQPLSDIFISHEQLNIDNATPASINFGIVLQTCTIITQREKLPLHGAKPPCSDRPSFL